MSVEAAAPAATAEAAPAVEAPAAEPSKDAPLESPRDTLDAHVAHAIKQAKRTAAAEKGKATKAEKAEKAAAKSEPAKAEPTEAEEAPEPEAPQRAGKTPRQLLDEGDIDGAFLEAFGKKPGDLNINSKRWSEHHKAVRKDREKLQQQVEHANRQLYQERHNVQELLRAAREEVRPYQPFIEAKKLYDAGDIEGAIKTAFGDDATAFNKRLIRSAHGKNPEVEALKAELERDRAERLREREEYQRQMAARQQAEQEQANMAWVTENLASVEDYDYAGAAKRPAFVRRVYEVLVQHYDADTNTTLPLNQAADIVRQEWEEHFGASFAPRGVPVSTTSVRGGSNPARQEAKPSRTLSQTGAAEASAPQRGAHGLSLDEHVRMFANGA